MSRTSQSQALRDSKAPARVETLELIQALSYHGRVHPVEQITALRFLQHPGQCRVESPPELRKTKKDDTSAYIKKCSQARVGGDIGSAVVFVVGGDTNTHISVLEREGRR